MKTIREIEEFDYRLARITPPLLSFEGNLDAPVAVNMHIQGIAALPRGAGPDLRIYHDMTSRELVADQPKQVILLRPLNVQATYSEWIEFAQEQLGLQPTGLGSLLRLAHLFPDASLISPGCRIAWISASLPFSETGNLPSLRFYDDYRNFCTEKVDSELENTDQRFSGRAFLAFSQ